MTTYELTRPAIRTEATRSYVSIGAGSGLLGFVLTIATIVIGGMTGTVSVQPGATADEIARAYATASAPLVAVGAALQMLAFLCLFTFATSLAGDRHSDWLSRLTVGAGQACVALTVAGFAIGSVARFRAGPDLDVSTAMALFDIHVALYVASWAFGSLFTAAAASLALRSRRLPIWLCVAAACIAVVDLAAVALPTSPLASFPNLLIWLWTLAASLSLVVRPARGTTSNAGLR
jgi:hypothetical protein